MIDGLQMILAGLVFCIIYKLWIDFMEKKG